MMIAPLLAELPYSTVASGPFNTVTFSISFGFKSAIRFVKSFEVLFCPAAPGTVSAALIAELSMMIPSTTNNGWLLRDIELNPLKIMVEDAPGTPDVAVIVAPAILPCKPFKKFSRCVSFTSSPFTVCAE